MTATTTSAKTILQCVRRGDSKDPTLAKITSELSLIPGDLALAGFEDALSSAWLDALGASGFASSLPPSDGLLDRHAGRSHTDGRLCRLGRRRPQFRCD